MNNLLSRILGLSLILAVTSAAPLAPAFAGGDRDPKVEKAIASVFPALVRIFVLMDEPSNGRLEKMAGAGSGAVIDEEGRIITNHHVAGRGRHYVCRMSDGEEIEARLIGTDALADIAVIQLDLEKRKSKKKIPVARFGDSDDVRVGDVVLAMGSPMAVSQSVTKGIVSNTALMMPSFMWWSSFKLDGESVGSLVRWIGHDAVIFGGNSGGPLVDINGRIVGINEVGIGSLGGAIPANLARSVADQLIQHGSVQRSWTGIEGQPRPKAMAATRGVLVAGVIAGSPAAESGLKPGDIVTEFDGVAVNAELQEDLPLFNALVMSTPIGKTVELKALRDGAAKAFRFATRTRGVASERDVEFKDWGLTARDFTMLSSIEKKRKSTDGVEITSVDAAGPAGAATPSMQAGDVLVAVAGKPVRNVAELKSQTAELLKDVKGDRPVLATFERGVSQYVTVVKVGTHETPPEETARKPGLQMVLQPIDDDLGQALGVDHGARAVLVYPDRTAAKGGIRAGDVLTRFDGEVVQCRQPEDVGRFQSRVRKYKTGSQVECEVLRDGKPVKLTLTLEEDNPPVSELKTFKDRTFEFTIRELTENERVTDQVPADVRGVKVSEVLSSGWASLAHVMVGDILLAVDGTPTPDVKTAEELLKAKATQKVDRMIFFLRRGVHTMFAEVEPNWNSITGDPASVKGK